MYPKLMKLCSNWIVMYPINYVAPYLHVYIKISKHFTPHRTYFIKIRDKKLILVFEKNDTVEKLTFIQIFV